MQVNREQKVSWISNLIGTAHHLAELGLMTAEAYTLATQLVNREKTKSQLIDEGFNRHAFLDKDGLPPWFLDDEMKHFRANLPVTKEAVNALRARDRAMNARPIKKVSTLKLDEVDADFAARLPRPKPERRSELIVV